MIVIDATDLLLGRLSSFTARKLLLGETVRIVNCEKSYISGSKRQIFLNYRKKRERGTHTTGPFFPRYPEMIVKRTVRGMLPFSNTRGREAYRRLRCYRGIPEELKNVKPVSITEAHRSKLSNIRYIEMRTLSKYLGAKIE